MQLELVDIALRGHALAMDEEFLPALVSDWSEYIVETKAGVISWKLLPREGDKTFVRFVVTAGLRWKPEADEASAVATVEAEYGMLFVAPDDFEGAAHNSEIAKQVVLAAWPYWRQDFMQMAAKASLPLVAIRMNPYQDE